VTAGYSFGVVAAGKMYAIVQNDGSNIKRRIKEIPQGLGVTTGLASDGKPEFGNISLNGEYDKVLRILRSIESWIASHVD
jgi:hypothetical protein